jgi:2-polyprenyl-3-methyl-5-hydroxy-6-metoxy-1,4-benzoquinol methylase
MELQMEYYIRKICRLCSSPDLEVVLKLKDSPLCDAYLTQNKKQHFYPLELNKCSECDFVQLNTVVSPEIIYRDYIYVTTSSPGLQTHFANYADDVCNYLNIEKDKMIVDIGSNDGSLLQKFKSLKHKVIGVEPATETAKTANDNSIPTYSEFFDKKLAKQILSENGTADIITINNLFANIDDLDSFILAVDILLDLEGVIVIESSYLIDMIQNMVFDFIYHEHLSYFSIKPLIIFFKNYGMNLIHVQKVATKGGSIRYFFARKESKWEVDSSVEILSNEEYVGDELKNLFLRFTEKISENKKLINDHLEQYKGKCIVGYGASATSTTLISHFALNEHITYLVDDNPDKIGTYSPGYQIPVQAPEHLKAEQPDVLIILAWRFKKEILEKLEELPCELIVPLPEFEVIR